VFAALDPSSQRFEELRRLKVSGRRIPENTVKRMLEVANHEYAGVERGGG
jgi:hypothetical protein